MIAMTQNLQRIQMNNLKYLGISYYAAEVAWHYFAKSAGYQLYSVEHKFQDNDVQTRFFLKRGNQILDWYCDTNNVKNLYNINYDEGKLTNFFSDTLSEFGNKYYNNITDWDKKYFNNFM